VHHGDQLGVGTNGFADRIRIDGAASVDTNSRDGKPVGAGEYGGMFDGCRNDVAVGRDAEDGEIVGLRAAAGEHDFAIETMQQGSDLAARVVELGAGGLSIMMDTGGVAENLGHDREHGLQDLWRHGRRRVVIEIVSLHGLL
jgi:hypothetical protein